jgi:uncharacterized protein YbjQ (UPF0145 family)
MKSTVALYGRASNAVRNAFSIALVTLFKDLFAGIRELVSGRSAIYERELQRARDIALREPQERAQEAGGNAVVGVDLDYEVLGQGNGMLMVSASGTAAIFE